MTRAVVMLDQSLSMPMRGVYKPAREMAAVVVRYLSFQSAHSLEGIVGFSEVAVEIPAEELTDTDFHFVYGTNFVAGILLGQQLLGHQPGRLIMFSDNEPTAHTLPHGDGFFTWPPAEETVTATIKQVDSAKDDGIVLDAFSFRAAPSEATETVLSAEREATEALREAALREAAETVAREATEIMSSAVSEAGGLVVHVTPANCDGAVRDYLQREWS